MPSHRGDKALAAWEASRAAKYTRKAFARDKADSHKPPPPRLMRSEPSSKPILCWCGELHGHDWPGKAEGEGHPR